MKTLDPRFRQLLLALAALAALGVAATALAQGPGPRGGGRGGQAADESGSALRLERLRNQLDLTDEQFAAIAELQEESRDANLALRKDVMRLRNAQRGELLKDEPSTDKVLALTREIGAKRTEMQANRVAARLAVRKLLTPEQRDQMLLQGGRENRRGRGGDGPGRGPGRSGRGPGRDGCGQGPRGGHGRN